jgi:hypothetical protein
MWALSVAAAYIFNFGWQVSCAHESPTATHVLTIADGGLMYIRAPLGSGGARSSTVWTLDRRSANAAVFGPFGWWFVIRQSPARLWWFVPLWVLAVPALIGGVILRPPSRRQGSGLCLNCRYPLAGLAARTPNCPECGAVLLISPPGSSAHGSVAPTTLPRTSRDAGPLANARADGAVGDG